MEIKNFRNKTLAADAETSAAMFIRKLPLALAGRFGLLLALDAGLLVVLTLAKIGQDVRPCALTLEATESTVQRLALFYLDFCHDFFPSPRIRRR